MTTSGSADIASQLRQLQKDRTKLNKLTLTLGRTG